MSSQRPSNFGALGAVVVVVLGGGGFLKALRRGELLFDSPGGAAFPSPLPVLFPAPPSLAAGVPLPSSGIVIFYNVESTSTLLTFRTIKVTAMVSQVV